MSEEFKHMDDAFRQMGEDFKVNYDPSYWNEMESQLSDHLMDDAFKTAAASSFVVPDMPDIGDIGATVDDAFVDDAFKNAASQQQAAYTAAYFTDFKTQEADLQMNDVFNEAANSSMADYSPKYWPDADEALQDEGLHYEYKESYWTEAKSLLDLVDRRQFFTRWSAAATVLLLLSFFSLNGIEAETPLAEAGQQNAITAESVEDSNPSDLISLADDSYSELISALTADYNDSEYLANNMLAADSEAVANDVAVNKAENNEEAANNEQLTNVEELVNDEEAPNDEEIPNNEELVNNEEIISNEKIVNVAVVNTEDASDREEIANNESMVNTTIEKFHIRAPGQNTIQSRYWSEGPNLSRKDNMQEEEMDFNMDFTKESNTTSLNIDRLPLTVIDHQLARYDALPPLVNIEKYRARPSHTLSVYGGYGIGREYGGNSSYLEASRRINGGIEYLHGLTGKLNRFEIGLSIGGNYVRQTNLSIFHDLRENGNASDNDWKGDGYRAWFRMAYTDIFHASAMLRVNYKIAAKHKFLFGVGYDHTFGLLTNRVGENFNKHNGLATENNVWTVTEGINSDMRFSFGYQYEIAKRLSLNLTGNLGVFDRTDDAHFGNSVMDQEYSLMLGFKYNLIRR